METWEVTFEDRNEDPSENKVANGRGVNVSKVERIASAVGGGALRPYAIHNRSKIGVLFGLIGAAFSTEEQVDNARPIELSVSTR